MRADSFKQKSNTTTKVKKNSYIHTLHAVIGYGSEARGGGGGHHVRQLPYTAFGNQKLAQIGSGVTIHSEEIRFGRKAHACQASSKVA